MLAELWNCYKILRWHKKTFKKATNVTQCSKIREESYELTEAFNNYQSKPKKNNSYKVDLETADVIISSICGMRFPEIRAMVDTKMIANYKRKWDNNHHIKDKKDVLEKK